MDALLYYFALSVVKCLQTLPLAVVAQIGRAAGALAYWLDGRHRRVATGNLTRCFAGEKSGAEIRALAKENFRRIGEAYSCAIKTAAMTDDELRQHLRFVGLNNISSSAQTNGLESLVFALGHFGNFELYARAAAVFPGYQPAKTYRAIRPASLNHLMLALRKQSGCLLFERRLDGAALRAAMHQKRLLVGFLSDQHAGNAGLWLSFFNDPCSTTAAPAVFAQRYELPLHVAICFRTAPAQWRVELSAEIPTHRDGVRRCAEEIMQDVNRMFEQAVRRDPANWFWVHNRWKPRNATDHRSRSSAGLQGRAPG